MLKLIASSGYGSFLAVLKTFSDIKSPGMMSFPKKGVTLALDFPNHGQNIFTLLDKLDCIVRDSGGSVYPAKDARMSSCSFQHYFPQWQEFQNYIDPIFSSQFLETCYRRTLMKKTIIFGATSAIAQETAKILAQNGHALFFSRKK